MASKRIELIKSLVDRRTWKPDRATIVRIDDNTVDIKISGSSNYIRNVTVRGSTRTISVGDILPIIWSENRPVVISDGGSYDYLEETYTDDSSSSTGGSGLSAGILVFGKTDLVESFEVSDSGLVSALASAFSGSTVYVPGFSFSGTFRVPSGVYVLGVGPSTYIVGDLYLSGSCVVENISVDYESSLADWAIAVYGPSSGVGAINHCWIKATCSSASGGAIGVSAERFGDIEIHDSVIAAHCDGSLGGYGIHSSAGRILMLGGTCYGTTAPTKTMVW